MQGKDEAAEGIGYIPVTRGHREGTNDCAKAFFFFALCCLGKIPGGAPFSQLLKSGNGSRVDRP